MRYTTDCYIFGRLANKEETLELFNSLFEKKIFKHENGKIVFIFEDGFQNITKTQVSMMSEQCRKLCLHCLFSWSCDDIGWGYSLYSYDAGRFDFRVPMESNLEKTEREFISFCGISDGLKLWDCK